jgi:CheY-like chemotaxis protein
MISDWETAAIPQIPSLSGPNWSPKDPARSPDECEQLNAAKKVRIIVIDDETLIAETIVEILSAEGFEVTAVSNGAAAVDLAKTFHPDIILSDVIMPGMNGIEMAIRIRGFLASCNIILFSGQAATVDLLAKAREQGHNFEVLAKPIRPHQLISVIRKRAGMLQ